MRQENLSICLIAIFLMLPIYGTAQYSPQSKKQVSEIKIVHSYTIKHLKSVKNILFVYDGSALYGDKFVNLSQKIKKRFKKRFNLGFQYNINNTDRYTFDRSQIPKNSNSNIKYDMMFKIRVEDFRFKEDKFSGNQMYTYGMTFEIYEPGGQNLVEFAQLEVHSSKTAFDTNRALVKLINKFITEK